MHKTAEDILIIDLESTCWENSTLPSGEQQDIDNMEIIEFGCALANRRGDVIDARSFLVRPTRNPFLSDFCTELTGITQSMVSEAPAFSEAAQALNAWLGDLPRNFVWCSWGNYDRLHFETQSEREGVSPSILSYPHLNLKRIWRRTTGQKKKNGLASALAFHNLDFVGCQHRGIDDAKNIARLLPFMDWSLEPSLVFRRKLAES
jgi:inhibitor of KinA sporulation pathway (predicted exonuclease)